MVLLPFRLRLFFISDCDQSVPVVRRLDLSHDELDERERRDLLRCTSVREERLTGVFWRANFPVTDLLTLEVVHRVQEGLYRLRLRHKGEPHIQSRSSEKEAAEGFRGRVAR